MKIPYSGLTGPFLAFAVEVEKAFNGLLSPRTHVVDSVGELPNPTPERWNGRQVHVRGFGTAICDRGVWVRTSDGSAV